jgi:hypothetical protein
MDQAIQRVIERTLWEFLRLLEILKRNKEEYPPEGQYVIDNMRKLNIIQSSNWQDQLYADLSDVGCKEVFVRALNLAKTFQLSTYPELQAHIQTILSLDLNDDADSSLEETVLSVPEYISLPGSRGNNSITYLTRTHKYSRKPELYTQIPQETVTNCTITLHIMNHDSTPKQNIIIDIFHQPLPWPGHSWMELEFSDNRERLYYGWSFVVNPANNPFKGAVAGILDRLPQDYPPTKEYSKSITEDQAKLIEQLWEDKKTMINEYSFEGNAKNSNSTFCTEALIDVLNKSAVLNAVESRIINAPYQPWSRSFPRPKPQDLERIARQTRDSRLPNPNEFELRVQALNATKVH